MTNMYSRHEHETPEPPRLGLPLFLIVLALTIWMGTNAYVNAVY